MIHDAKCLIIALPLYLLPGQLFAQEPTDAEILFVRRVQPILQAKCIACHGDEATDLGTGFDLRTKESMLQGGDNQELPIVAGKPDSSPLYLAITRTDENWSAMPPKETEKLSAEQVGWIRDWIDKGADWPDAARVEAINKQLAEQWSAEAEVAVATQGGLSPDWSNRKYRRDALWAYQPVRKPKVPIIESCENAIDAFLAQSSPPGVTFAPAADRVTLIRRATFDLTGLPPRPDEVQAFLDDTESDQLAFAKVVDRLLDSPQYGERMAQHWLDVVRYADSSGFANDFERGSAWRYRDYVVRAFNLDKPYDQFVREQIAGDEIDPANSEFLVATGFLRMGPWELTGMEVAKVARQRFLDDVTNSVGETFLAHSLQCARCHDHKFDPIPTHDYYSVQAVFSTMQLAERPAPFLPIENCDGFDERKYLELRRDDYIETLARLDEKSLQAAQAWFADNRVDPAAWNAEVARVRERKTAGRSGSIFSVVRNAFLTQGVAEDQFPPKLLGFTTEDFGNERIARKGLERLQWEFDRYETYALSVYSGRTPTMTSVVAPLRIPQNHTTDGNLEETCILIGGSPFAPGTPVGPGALTVLSSTAEIHAVIPDGIDGRRRAFAEWVANPNNPLTTRAIVNRIWQWHFGRAIAGNPNNFGATGKRPTHPELLDWLAASFVEDGWSFKRMHRRIMNSEAYRRSSEHADAKKLAELDPLGSIYAVFQPRRLTAEELRDAMLAVTGELNPVIGGIPNRPEINLEAALQPRQVMGTFASAWTPNPKPEQRHRRSIYALKLRGLADPFLEVFNAPAPDFSCERRETSTVTPQVFAMFNGKASQSRALAFANRAIKDAMDTPANDRDRQAIVRCFQLAYSRTPSPQELSLCLDHWQKMESMQAAASNVQTAQPKSVRRDAVEENTGERFSFDERLYANDDFIPDLQPDDVDAHVRGLADVCLVLFNANEFAYVY